MTGIFYNIQMMFLSNLHDLTHVTRKTSIMNLGEREQVRRQLSEVGIQTSVHYPAVHKFGIYREVGSGSDLLVTYNSSIRLLIKCKHECALRSADQMRT